MKAWGQPTKGRSSHLVNEEVTSELDLSLAEEAARCTRELLNSQGWCLWKCNSLDGDIIVVVTDEMVTGYPEGYPVYTELEFEELYRDGVSQATLRLVHETKKMAGAKVTTEVTKIEGGDLWRS